jgi:hypothetical protein
MSDWIDKRKEQEAAAKAASEKERQQKSHDEHVISIKGPDLWKLVIKRVEHDVHRLDEVFPNDPTKHIQYSAHPDGFRLQGPVNRLEAYWSKEINGVELTVISREHPQVPAVKSRITFSVGVDGTPEEIMMNVDGVDRSAPAAMAQYLIEKVL